MLDPVLDPIGAKRPPAKLEVILLNSLSKRNGMKFSEMGLPYEARHVTLSDSDFSKTEKPLAQPKEERSPHKDRAGTLARRTRFPWRTQGRVLVGVQECERSKGSLLFRPRHTKRRNIPSRVV